MHLPFLEVPRLGYLMQQLLYQKAHCGLDILGLCLSSLLCTPCLFLLEGVPLIFNHRVGNIVCTSLDCLTGLALLVVQVIPYCCCHTCHDGTVCIAGVIVCL